MCNRYQSPSSAAIENQWDLAQSAPWQAAGVYPRANGIFIRCGQHGLESVVGRWGLIPPFANTAGIGYATNNARSEELSNKPSYRDAWRKGQRCIIPAVSFDEPCWETGKNVWHTFRRSDGKCWGLAGLWNTWVDKQTGEMVESYTMLTVNADAHPVMRRMHKPDPNYPPDEQDKRSVVAIQDGQANDWLMGATNDVLGFICPPEPTLLQYQALGSNQLNLVKE